MPQHWRILWNDLGNHARCRVLWPAIDAFSYVVVTVAEGIVPGPESTPTLQIPVERFVGDARHMQATNIAPFAGGVDFSVHWAALSVHQPFVYLNVWTDITVFDAADPSFVSQTVGEHASFEQARPDRRGHRG